MRVGAHANTQSAYTTPQSVQTPGMKTPPLIQAAKATAHAASHTASDAGPAAATGISSQTVRIVLAAKQASLVKPAIEWSTEGLYEPGTGCVCKENLVSRKLLRCGKMLGC
jgi:hypothetical protein